jgi:hypothetical protein
MAARNGNASMMAAFENAQDAKVLHQLGIHYGQGFEFLGMRHRT